MFEPVVVTKNMPDKPEPVIETIISPKTIKENLSSYTGHYAVSYAKYYE